jgi:hypothetical protein
MTPKLSKPVSPSLNLSPEQIAAAHLVGVAFPPATPAQVQRLAMQRKVFRIAGTAVLATRDGTFFETAATLAPLIAEGERQQRDLVAWEAAVPMVEPPAPPPNPERPVAAALAPAAPDLEPATAPETALPLEADAASAEEEAPAPAALVALELQAEAVPKPALVMPLAVNRRVPSIPERKARCGERWLTAGAERRGRLAQHWSRRR